MPKRQRKDAQEHIESYLFGIEEIFPEYGFGVNRSRSHGVAYNEYAHTSLAAICLAPSKLAGRATSFTLLGDREVTTELNNPMPDRGAANGLGTLTMRGHHSEYLGTMPFDVLLALSPVILAKGLKFIILAGPPLRHGSTRISYMAFRTNENPDDY